MEYFIGIDNSSLDHKVRVIDERGNQKLSTTINNNLDGFIELNKKIKIFNNSKIGFELPHGPIVDYFHSKKYNLYSLNPLKIKRYKESLKVSGNKNDDIDAHAIAKYLLDNRDFVRELKFNSSKIERLKTFSIIHTRLTHDKTRHLNKLHFVVRQYFPLQEALFANFGCKIQLKLLKQYPSFENLRDATDDEIKEFLMKHGYRRNEFIDKQLKKIRSYNQQISPDVAYAYQFEAQCLCDIILLLISNLETVENEMKQITASHHLGKIFQSIPGAGTVLSCKLLAIFGDNKDRFEDYNSAQCLFGTAPKNYQSGSYHKVIMRRACNKSARAIMFKFAFTSIRFCSWARDYYDNQRSKNKKHSVAIRALSNKWVKVIFKIWQTEILYDKAKKISIAA